MASIPNFLKSPYTLMAIAAAAILVIFRNQVSGALGQYGGGLATFGSGVQSFISSVSSPKINPSIGLTLGGVFGDIQSGINQWYQDTYRSGKQSGTSSNSVPHSTGGINLAQATNESSPKSTDTLGLNSTQSAFYKRLRGY